VRASGLRSDAAALIQFPYACSSRVPLQKFGHNITVHVSSIAGNDAHENFGHKKEMPKTVAIPCKIYEKFLSLCPPDHYDTLAAQERG
jgi:hypothetical protein